ncbi:MAG: hypothetical protein H0X27_12825 [Caulobacteraceae bacterium]|nr:hypothetical protein [Caulobacteraceae bacterium]
MSPAISISEGLFGRLQQHAVALVDSPETVISRALDALEAGSHAPPTQRVGPRAFNPASPPNLAFTTVRKITLDGITFKKGETYWNPLMFACLRAAAKKGLSPTEIGALMVVPHVVGKKEDNGYVFIQEAGVSVQGQASNGAWKQAHHIASALGVPLVVEFVWQNNEKAALANIAGSFRLG